MNRSKILILLFQEGGEEVDLQTLDWNGAEGMDAKLYEMQRMIV